MALHSFPAPSIGPLKLATPILLAPLSGYCDVGFRLVTRELGGVGLACTDLLCPQGLLRENTHSLQLVCTESADSPLAMQLYGSPDDPLPEAARWAEDHGADVVDINMGCPVQRITDRNQGSRLLCDPDAAVRLAERVRRALQRVPLTVKLRLGWDRQHIVAPALAARLEEAGVEMIVVHGRTADEQFSGSVDLDGIAAVVAAVRRIPVIGNGDIREAADAECMMRRTGCAGVMIGRGALSRPWLLRDAAELLAAGVTPPPPTLRQKCAIIARHFAHLARHRDERTAVLEFRKRISWYARELHPCRMLRDEMRHIRCAADFHRAIERFLEWRDGVADRSESSKTHPA